MLNTIAIATQVISSLVLILLVLLHAGKGGGLSDMFGGGGGLSSGTSLERRLDKLTVILAVLFGLTTLFLDIQSSRGKL